MNTTSKMSQYQHSKSDAHTLLPRFSDGNPAPPNSFLMHALQKKIPTLKITSICTILNNL